MNMESAKRAQAAIARRGELISVRRMAATTPQTVSARADVKATVHGYDPSELVNGITAGTRKIVLSRLDLEAVGFPVPPIKGDRIYLGAALDAPTTIQTVDTDRREYQGCFEITATGY